MIRDDDHHDQRYEDGDMSTGTNGDYEDDSTSSLRRELVEAADFYAGKKFDRDNDPSYWLD